MGGGILTWGETSTTSTSAWNPKVYTTGTASTSTKEIARYMQGVTATTDNYKIYLNRGTYGTNDWNCNWEITDTDTVITGTYNWATNCWYEVDNDWRTVSLNPRDRLRDIIRSRQAPAIHTRRLPGHPEDLREIRARETLCRVLGENNFRRFLRTGFVTVRGRSGDVYQIFPGHGITNVYRNGKEVDRLCVVLRGHFPPTDSLIMRYLLILNDENEFRSLAIQHRPIAKADANDDSALVLPLTQVFKDLKQAAGQLVA